jgi:hypothetical protein
MLDGILSRIIKVLIFLSCRTLPQIIGFREQIRMKGIMTGAG